VPAAIGCGITYLQSPCFVRRCCTLGTRTMNATAAKLAPAQSVTAGASGQHLYGFHWSGSRLYQILASLKKLKRERCTTFALPFSVSVPKKIVARIYV
jgi:hypothetical protein